MHMADALISPAVGGTMWVVSGGLLTWCASRGRRAARGNLVPLRGVLGAFIFAAQMLNFSIPGTGSSGHLGGGLILTLLVGPAAAFLVMATVLTVQALFFADGGLLALGCNIFNLGFFPAFVAFPFIYRPLAGAQRTGPRAAGAAILAAVAGLLMGATGVVVQTRASGISELPFGPFIALMLPIHAAIGVVEGLATAAVVAFVARARPETITEEAAPVPVAGRTLAVLALAAVLLGGLGSWFASTHPDGLEWAIGRTAGSEELAAPAEGIHARLAVIQEKTAVLPDYDFAAAQESAGPETAPEPAAAWPAVSAGTSVAGVVGAAITLGLALLFGLLLRAGANRRTSLPT